VKTKFTSIQQYIGAQSTENLSVYTNQAQISVKQSTRYHSTEIFFASTCSAYKSKTKI